MITIKRRPSGEAKTIVNAYTGCSRNEATGEFSPDHWFVNTFVADENNFVGSWRQLENVRLPDGSPMADVAYEIIRQVKQNNPDEIHGVSASGEGTGDGNILGLLVFGALNK